MAELRQILELWRAARASGEDVCLATVVRVEGSSYRKPGARMLLTSGGHRAGTISGGCLEGEVQKKAWWLTESGSTVQRYSSFYDEDSEMPYGLGCGGTVYVLLERSDAVDRALSALVYGAEHRLGIAFVSVIDTNEKGGEGTRLIVSDDGYVLSGQEDDPWREAAEKAIRDCRSYWLGDNSGLFVEYVPPPPALFVFGAGDDAQPIVEFAHRLGWVVTVADGRSHLARAERFPLASEVVVSRKFEEILPQERDAAVILTHSYEQDRAALRAMLPLEIAYLGILGPKLRTERLLAEIAPELDLTFEECRSRLHSPVGLDIGAKDPVGIALSITAEIHAVLEKRAAVKRRPSAAHARK
jgi:xanthine/CO dehydrogenase XdhC/CoxF family maturation factor